MHSIVGPQTRGKRVELLLSLPDETNRHIRVFIGRAKIDHIYSTPSYNTFVRGMFVIFGLVLAMLKINLHYVVTPNIKLHFDRGLSRSATDKNNRTPIPQLSLK